MKKSMGVIVIFALAGLMALPAAAGELRVTGFIDTAITTDQNMSNQDSDVTKNKDTATIASTRSQIFFNFFASDNLRGIAGIELDASWGAPARNRFVGPSGCLTAEQCGFRNGIDISNFQLKQLYVDFRIPQIPIGNRWR
ncbi:MAG: hypothetical protein HYZ81_07930, partial [Nitrospinae bacterium]|nr:hypothetical protein [Nitrospinota bacterium]